MATELEKKQDAALAAPSEFNRPFEMEGAEELEKMIPRVVLHQGKMSKKFWGDHAEGTLLDSVTQQVLSSPLKFVPIGINWTEFIRYGENIGDPIVYRTRDKSDVPAEDLEWHGNEPPACESLFNFVCAVEGRDIPIAISMRGSSKHQKKFAGALYQFEKIRSASKRGPGLYELAVADTSNEKGEWKIPVLRSCGDPSNEMATTAKQWWASMRGQDVQVHVDERPSSDAYDPNVDD